MSETGTGRERGFTILELLIVIALIGLLTSIGAQATFFSPTTLDRSADRVENRLHTARQQARKSGRPVVVACSKLASDGTAGAACLRGQARADSLIFYPDGSSNAATVELRDDTGRVRFSVDWLTGEIGREG